MKLQQVRSNILDHPTINALDQLGVKKHGRGCKGRFGEVTHCNVQCIALLTCCGRFDIKCPICRWSREGRRYKRTSWCFATSGGPPAHHLLQASVTFNFPSPTIVFRSAADQTKSTRGMFFKLLWRAGRAFERPVCGSGLHVWIDGTAVRGGLGGHRGEGR